MDTLEPADVDQASGSRLRAIADQLVRLGPSRTNPHAFHETKSDLVHELRSISLGLDQVRVLSGPAHRAMPLPINPLRANSTTTQTPSTAAGVSHCRHCLRRLRRAVRLVNEILGALRLEKHPDKTAIGRIERGFDFLGYRFSREGLGLAKATIQRFVERAARLYEQGREQPNGCSRLGVYVRRWVGWAKGGLSSRRTDPGNAGRALGGGPPLPTPAQLP
jgi:hypothetical protein